MKKLFIWLLVVVVAAGLASVIWHWDAAAPAVGSEGGPILGPGSTLRISATDEGRGLRSIQLALRQAEVEKVLAEHEFPLALWPWQRSEPNWNIELAGWKELNLSDGPLEVLVKVEDQPNLFFLARRQEMVLALDYDTKPPRLEILSRQHYLRQGGSEALLYGVNEAGTSGVRVGNNEFLGYPLEGQGEGTHLSLFALAHDQSPDVPIVAWAEDRAGNRVETPFFCKTFGQRFRRRTIDVSDAFITSVAPGILAQTPGLEEASTPLDTFLRINRDLREVSNGEIAAISQRFSPDWLWNEPFLQLTNSKVEAVFADYRTYRYRGQECDRQVHLGFDLASLAQSPVEASNAGRVALAEYLGIYGNTVILEHGFGLFSLYGHLSSIGVEEGQLVVRGETLGRTGQTGLAGGDHLHFTMVLQGVQVNPVEWWDAKWVTEHVLLKHQGLAAD